MQSICRTSCDLWNIFNSDKPTLKISDVITNSNATVEDLNRAILSVNDDVDFWLDRLKLGDFSSDWNNSIVLKLIDKRSTNNSYATNCKQIVTFPSFMDTSWKSNRVFEIFSSYRRSMLLKYHSK